MSKKKRSFTFEPPSLDIQKRALGDLSKYDIESKKVFDVESKSFDAIAIPKPGDWLCEYNEKRQTVPAFLCMKSAWPSKQRNKICIQPMGDFESKRCPDLTLLNELIEAFFDPMQVIMAPNMRYQDAKKFTAELVPTTSSNTTHVCDINDWLLSSQAFKHRQQIDKQSNNQSDQKSDKHSQIDKLCFCFTAITLDDLYPEDAWNFCYGLANPSKRTGVWSLCRFDPTFPNADSHQEPSEQDKQLIFLRSAKVILHEIAHVFGLDHCVFFNCIMNGSNHDEELDNQPCHFCPICLCKLDHVFHFKDYFSYYLKIEQVFKIVGLQKEAEWCEKRREEIGRKASSQELQESQQQKRGEKLKLKQEQQRKQEEKRQKREEQEEDDDDEEEEQQSTTQPNDEEEPIAEPNTNHNFKPAMDNTITKANNKTNDRNKPKLRSEKRENKPSQRQLNRQTHTIHDDH